MIERKLFFGIDDIKGLCLECLTCKGRVHLPLDRLRTVPSSCPVCSAEWGFVVSSHQVSNSDYVNFAFALRKLREVLVQGGTAFRVLLEFEEPKA